MLISRDLEYHLGPSIKVGPYRDEVIGGIDLFRIRGNKTLEIIFSVIFRCLNWCYRFGPLSPPRGGGSQVLDATKASS